MKYAAVLTIASVAFALGRYSVDRGTSALPGVPIAFVQATQPIAITIDVDLAVKDGAATARDGVHQLKGSANYQFKNITDAPMSIAFPPTRTLSISSSSLGHDPSPCPAALSAQQIVEIPANSSTTLSGPWSETVTGNLDTFLQGGPGGYAFTFSSPHGERFFNGTLLAFQAFSSVQPKSSFHTTEGHLKLVSSLSSH